MKHKAVTAYLSDTSGSQPKPIKGSRVLAENRVMYMTHENLVKGLLMDGLGPTSDRFERILTTSLQNAQVEDEWTHLPDFLRFFEDHLGSAILESIFGQALLAENPGFVRDLWAYDDVVMGLAKRLPRWMIPKSYKLRDKLRQGVKKWHTLAKKFDARTCTDDPVKEGLLWGSTAMRERNKMLLSVAKQTEDSVASTDLGLIWATVTNVVPSSMTLALHLFRDSSLLGEARSLMAPHVQRDPSLVIDMRKIEKQPLLQSVYAETLRFGVQIHVPRTTPHSDLKVGGTMLPRGKMILTNTWLAHTDEEVWNTKGNAHPLETFWPQRFLIDPKDSSSGPTKKPTRPSGHPAADEGVQFSAEGLEGAWIPYGGGHHACPGRLLAKRIMLLSCTLMATMFDVEILASNEAMEFGSPRFGFGVRKPNGKIPFRIRRRRNVSFSV
ncbi:MAG: hypothetical protein M1821_007552 [Bathelium mastoideum]|nr:MAG: hypothetical protein M1821_007552 [Bathelium mastoideum]